MQGGTFVPSGRTYWNNCIINPVTFLPFSYNENPNRVDEFLGCTINTDPN
jgi:hypothetical protein